MRPGIWPSWREALTALAGVGLLTAIVLGIALMLAVAGIQVVGDLRTALGR